jgi:hypothetical protein
MLRKRQPRRIEPGNYLADKANRQEIYDEAYSKA